MKFLDTKICFSLKKRVVGNSCYWYIPLEVFKLLELKDYEELEVALIKKIKPKIKE